MTGHPVRRAMLLALGVDVTDIPIEACEGALTVSASPDWDVISFDIHRDAAAEFEVTSYGDAERRYVKAPARTRFNIRVRATYEALASRAKRLTGFDLGVLHFDETVGHVRVRATLLVKTCRLELSVGDMACVANLTCEPHGEVLIEDLRTNTKPESDLRRGIALGGPITAE